MKKRSSLTLLTAAAMLLGVETASSQNVQLPESPAQQVVSINYVTPYKKTSFQEVTKTLHPNGDFYMYMNTKGIVEKISEFSSTFIEALKLESGTDTASIKILEELVKSTGLAEIDSLGISSVQVSEEFHNRRTVLFRGNKKSEGLIWNLGEKNNQDLNDIFKLLPEDTAYANFNTLNLTEVLKWVEKWINNCEDETLKQQFNASLQMVTAIAGKDIWTILNSLENKMTVVATLDDKKTITILDFPAKIPEFSLALVIDVNDSTVFDLLRKFMPPALVDFKTEGEVSYLESKKTGEFPFIRPVFLQSNKKLIISLNKVLSDKILNPNKNSLSTNADFIKMSKNVPSTGVGFDYISPKISVVLSNIMSQVVADQPSTGANSKEMEGLQKELAAKMLSFPKLFSVTQAIDHGYLNVSHTTQTTGEMIVGSTVAPIAIMAAIAVPSLSKNREMAIKQTKKANQKMVSAASCNCLASDPSKDTSDLKWSDITEYLDPKYNTLESLAVSGVTPVFEGGKLIYDLNVIASSNKVKKSADELVDSLLKLAQSAAKANFSKSHHVKENHVRITDAESLKKALKIDLGSKWVATGDSLSATLHGVKYSINVKKPETDKAQALITLSKTE